MGSNTFFDIAKELFFLVPGELRRVELESVATPSFVTATKEYFGSEEEIRRVLSANEYEIPNDWKDMPSARIIGARGFWADDIQHEHLNIWDYTYHLSSRKVLCLMVWLECEGLFYRCFRAAFYQLVFKSELLNQDFRPVTVSWGLNELIDINLERVKNTLFEIDKTFDSEDELQADLMAIPGMPDFEPFFDDIFADG